MSSIILSEEINEKFSLPPPVQNLYNFSRDHWSFLTQAVSTLDQADKSRPVKRYPSKDYLYYITNKIVKEATCAIVKHRRMIVTWSCCSIALWDAMFNEGRFVAMISKKEEDSDELVGRCKFIYDNIPDELLPFKPKMVYKYTEIKFPEIDSVIKGFAQGPDQLRQYTCSRIFADECAFWPQARQTFVAMKPTLEGGGKICLFSTRFPGFFQKLIEDTLDDND